MPRDKATNAYLDELNVCITGYSYGKPEYTERLLERLVRDERMHITFFGTWW